MYIRTYVCKSYRKEYMQSHDVPTYTCTLFDTKLPDLHMDLSRVFLLLGSNVHITLEAILSCPYDCLSELYKDIHAINDKHVPPSFSVIHCATFILHWICMYICTYICTVLNSCLPLS